MIASAARLHGRASSRRRVYMRGSGNDNRLVRGLLCLHDPRRDLTAQPFETKQSVGAGLRDLNALGRKMLAEELEMRRALMELLWRQYRGEYRHFGAQLHIHQRLDHGVRDKFMAVHAAIDHESRSDDRRVPASLGEQLRVQRDFERTRHLEQIDMRAGNAARLDLAKECEAAFLDHLAVPGGLYEGDPLRFCKSRVRGNGRMISNFRGAFYFGRVFYFRRVFYFGSVLQHLIHGFPLSGPESGHTERRAARNAAVATVLFHPDFNRRLRNHTESADPSSGVRKALAGLGFVTLTAGGDFHPALRTLAARYERPKRIMAIGWDASKDLRMGNPHVPMTPELASDAVWPVKLTIKADIRRARGENSARRTRNPRIRFRFVLMAIVNAREELWTSRALSVDGLAVPLRGFRKSHHLIPASLDPDTLWAIRGLQLAATRHASACRPAACGSNIVSEFCNNKVETACPSSKALSIPGTIRSRWSRTSPPITTGRSNAPAKTR